jgi:hypothetical protein
MSPLAHGAFFCCRSSMDRLTARLQRTSAVFGYLALNAIARHAVRHTPKHPLFPRKAPGLNLEAEEVQLTLWGSCKQLPRLILTISESMLRPLKPTLVVCRT